MKKKKKRKIIIGFFFTPHLFLATKVAISFVCYSPKTIKCTQKPKIEKKFTGIDQSSERASAILHIISTTRSCACAQFTSEKGPSCFRLVSEHPHQHAYEKERNSTTNIKGELTFGTLDDEAKLVTYRQRSHVP